MNSYKLVSLSALALMVVGCQPMSAPDSAKEEKPVAVAPKPDTEARDQLAMAYRLLDAPYASVKLSSGTPVKVVVDIRLGGKDIVFKDWFIAGPGFVEGSNVTVGCRPVDNGELERARRMRYGIACGATGITHLVRNPFAGLILSSSTSSAEGSVDGKPVTVFHFTKKTSAGLKPVPGKAPAIEPDAADMRVSLYKPTDAELKAVDAKTFKHEEAPVAKKRA